VCSYFFREKVVETLENLCTEWREAAAAQESAKLHTIVDTWLGIEITPAEFRRTHRLGHVSMPSSIERISDTPLKSKLDKVCFYFKHDSCFWFDKIAFSRKIKIQKQL
jgi:hypothetical protein